MKLHRRRFLALSGGSLLATVAPSAFWSNQAAWNVPFMLADIDRLCDEAYGEPEFWFSPSEVEAKKRHGGWPEYA